MLSQIFLVAATGLATFAHGAALPDATSDNNANAAVSALQTVPDDLTIEARNVTARAVVDPAVRFTEFEGRACGGWSAAYKTSDQGCFLLPTGDGFKIRDIADTCRGLFSSSWVICIKG